MDTNIIQMNKILKSDFFYIIQDGRLMCHLNQY